MTMLQRPLWYDGWMYRHRGTLPAPIEVSNAAGLIDITSQVAALGESTQVNGQPITYDAAGDVFKCTPDIKLYYGIELIVTLSGTFANNSSSSSYEFSLLRPDGITKIRTYIFDRPDGLLLTFNFGELFDAKTFVFDTGTDPYQVDGFKLGLQHLTGADLTLDSQQDLGAGLVPVEQEFRFIGQ